MQRWPRAWKKVVLGSSLLFGFCILEREAKADSGSAEGDATAVKKEPEKKKPARPPLPEEPPATRLPWERHLEIGLDAALVNRPARSTFDDGEPTAIRYRPALGLGFHARWAIWRYIWFSTYFVGASHDLLLLPGAFVVNLPGTVRSDAVIDAKNAKTITFGARLMPTLPLTDRARVWLSVGIGYGRFDFGQMTIQEPGQPDYIVRERGTSFAEIPVGIGSSLELIRNWFAIHVEVTGSFIYGQEGESVERAQAIDGEGRRRTIGGLPKVNASFVQMVGLSLIL